MPLMDELARVARLIEEAKRRVLEISRPIEPESGWRTLGAVVAHSLVEWRAGVIVVVAKTVPLLLERGGRAKRVGPVRSTAYLGLSSFRPEERGAFMSTVTSALAASQLLQLAEPDALFICQTSVTFPPEVGVRERPPVNVLKVCRELMGILNPTRPQEVAYKGAELAAGELASTYGLKLSQPLSAYLGEYCAMAAALARLEATARETGVPLAWLSKCSRSLSRRLKLEAWVTDEALLSFAWEEVDRAALCLAEVVDDEWARQLTGLTPLLAMRRVWYYKLGPAGGIGRMARSGSPSEGWYLLGVLASAADRRGRLRALERGALLAAVRREELESAWSQVRRAFSSSPLRLLLS